MSQPSRCYLVGPRTRGNAPEETRRRVRDRILTISTPARLFEAFVADIGAANLCSYAQNADTASFCARVNELSARQSSSQLELVRRDSHFSRQTFYSAFHVLQLVQFMSPEPDADVIENMPDHVSISGASFT